MPSYRRPSFLALALLAWPAWAQLPPTAPAEDARALLLQARGLQRRGGGDDPRAAIALYRRVIELLPSSSEAHLRLSEALAESGDMEPALAEARKATELAPERPEAAAHLALLLHRRLQNDTTVLAETRQALEAASRLLPQEVEIWARLGEVAEQAKDSPTAMTAWLKVGRLRPQIAFAWEKAAYFAHNLNQYDAKREAIMSLCSGKSPDGKHLRWLEDLARDQLKAGYLGHAEDSFRLLARHFSQEPGVWENMALVQLNTSRFDEALASLKEAEKLRSTPRLALNAAFCLMNLGDLPGAEARLRKLFMEASTGPDAEKLHAEARVLLASTLLLQDRPAQLLELLQGWPETEAQAELLGLRAQARIRVQDWKGARNAAVESGGDSERQATDGEQDRRRLSGRRGSGIAGRGANRSVRHHPRRDPLRSRCRGSRGDRPVPRAARPRARRARA